jgi:outer membrane protein assembly factor BamB
VKRRVVALGALVALLALAACDKDKDPDPPAELAKIAARLEIDRVWSTGLGGGADVLRLALRPHIVGERVYAVSHDGEIEALEAANGHRIWRTDTKLPLSAGPGADESLVAAGSSDGDVVALDAETGAERWRTTLTSEVLASPIVAGDAIYVRTVDGRLFALSATDGSRRWEVLEPVPRLSLRGTAAPVLAGDAVVCGFDSGKVVSVERANGDVLWDTMVSAPHGRTELERLVDLDAGIKVAGDDLYVVGFQGRMAMLARDSGQIWWARDMSSYRGFGIDDDNLYVTDAESNVIAMRRRDGTTVWEQAALHRRGVTAPAVEPNGLVVGDFEGYVHWLDRSSGEIIARAKTDGERITNSPVVVDGTVYLMTDGGTLIAFRSTPRS